MNSTGQGSAIPEHVVRPTAADALHAVLTVRVAVESGLGAAERQPPNDPSLGGVSGAFLCVASSPLSPATITNYYWGFAVVNFQRLSGQTHRTVFPRPSMASEKLFRGASGTGCASFCEDSDGAGAAAKKLSGRRVVSGLTATLASVQSASRLGLKKPNGAGPSQYRYPAGRAVFFWSSWTGRYEYTL